MAWREALCNILEATDQNLRAASPTSHTHPSAVLQKVSLEQAEPVKGQPSAEVYADRPKSSGD